MHIKLETICVKVTNRCNLNCGHCWSPYLPPSLDLPPHLVINFIDSLKPLGLKHVSLSGGEPTLYPQAEFLINELLERGFDLSLTTNGTLTRNLTHLMNTLPATLSSRVNIRVSIDGWRSLHDQLRGTGTFDAAITSVAHVAASMGQVSLNTVVSTTPTCLEELLLSLPIRKIRDWALLTPITRELNSKSMYAANDVIFKNIDLWEKELSKLIDSTTVRVWDYLRHPNGGFVVESNRLLTLPGLDHSQDIIVGDIETISQDTVRSHIAHRLSADPIAYFSMR